MTFPEVPLSEILILANRPETPAAGKLYRQIGVRLWGGGAYEREPIDGMATQYQRLFQAKANDVIVNKIWARNGSVAVVPEQLDGCYGSNEFPMFTPRREKLEPKWFHWLTKTKGFWQKCDQKSRGTSGKNRIRPERFLEIEIPLPDLCEQRRIVVRVEQLAARVESVRRLRADAIVEVENLTGSNLYSVFERLVQKYESRPLGELIVDAGYGTSVKCNDQRMHGAVPVLRIPNVVSERINFENMKFAILSDSELGQVEVGVGDVLIVRTNGSLDLVGRSALVTNLPERTAFASYLIRIQCDQEHIRPNYLQTILKHLRIDGKLIDLARTTAGQYNVSLGRLRAAKIPIPPLEEQDTIVASLDGLEERVNALKRFQTQTAPEIEALIPSILDRAFQGEL